MIKNIFILLRPYQWMKNLFVFLPLFFDRHLFDWNYFLPAVIAFFAYNFAASSIYCFNDINDVAADHLHPRKYMRPIARGVISKKNGYILMGISLFISLAIILISSNLIESSKLISILTFYYVMNIAYCIRLKQTAIVDVFIIAIGYVLRILVGGVATGVFISHWIILMTFLLALFLAFAKRRDDVVIYEASGIKVRKNIERYNLDFMNQATTIVASITIVCYIMYTISEDVIHRMHSHYVYVTSIFVLAGIIRYLQVTIVDTKSGSPTKVLMEDRFVQICVIGWLLTFTLILYL